MKRLIFVLFIFCSFANLLSAQEDISDNNYSITISPFHLFNPELYVSGEFRLAPKVSVAAMLGAGSISYESSSSNIWEIGGQFRYYLFGTFKHGMMIGADAGYVDINKSFEDQLTNLAGLHAGGFLGYKYSMKIGFTLELLIGPVYVWGNSAENSELQTLVNLKIGWSF